MSCGEISPRMKRTLALGYLTGLGTGVATALAKNVGAAGAPVLFNGAGGTPSSIVLTNATGTAASLTAGVATVANTVSTVNEGTDTTCFPAFVSASGTNSLQILNNTNLTFNASTAALGAKSFVSSASAGAAGLNLATNDAYAEVRVLQNSLNASDKHMYFGFNSGATSHLNLYSNNTLVQTISGGAYITSTTQPAFFAFANANLANVTGDGTIYTVIFNSKSWDQNTNYNASTGVFTAPVAGIYTITWNVMAYNLTTSHNALQTILVTTLQSYYSVNINPANVISQSSYLTTGTNTIQAQMAAGDTAHINFVVYGSTKTIGVYAAPWGYFSAILN